jgi:cold shock CspA family protein
MMYGKIKFVNEEKNYGFLVDEFGADWFFTSSDLLDMVDKNTAVEFEEGKNKRGICAVNIRKTSY